MNQKKVFISYTHDSEEHKSWVRKLSEDLEVRGVHIMLDQWTVGPGDNLAVFMEQSYHNADYILLICTANYAYKMKNRLGGVRYEVEMIAGALMYGEDNQKFIPILREGNAAENLPQFLKTRYFVSFTDDREYINSLDILTRKILDAPIYNRPPLSSASLTGPLDESLTRQVPKARIMVTGTGILSQMTRQIEEAARMVGIILARNHYGLITCGWTGVDEITARAFSDTIIEKRLPLENFLTQVIFKNSQPQFMGGNLVLIEEDQEFSEPIRQSNGVILIHGLGGTLQMGKLGLQSGLPVFPLAETGGDAGRLYMQVLQNWNQVGYQNLSVNDFQKLGRPVPAVFEVLPELLDIYFIPQ